MGAPRPVFPRGAALWAFLLASLGGVAGQPLGAEPTCTAQPLARYSVTFTGKWSQASFPKQYPLFRPPAQWSSLLGECRPRPAPGRPVGTEGLVTQQRPHTSQFGGHPHPSLHCKRYSLRSSAHQQLGPGFRDVGGRITQQGAGVEGGTVSPGWCSLTRAGGASQGAGFRVLTASPGWCSLVWVRDTPGEPGLGGRRRP